MTRQATRFALLALALSVVALPAAAQPNTGQADFTRYVAIGDSLTAGFSSGGLVRSVQITSYPALIHRQATAATTGFEQPLVGEPGIPPVLTLRSLFPLVIAPRPGPAGAPQNLTLPRPYNNLGIPGARIHDVVATTTGGIFDLILRNPNFGNTTALQQALGLMPTFATVWVGNNDVLAAATSGRVIEGVTITPVASFQADFQAIVGALTTAGARLAIANIPDVTSIPFVTTIRPFVVNPQTQQPVIVNGQTVPLIGPNGPLGAGDNVLLTAAAELATGRGIPAALGGSGQPLSDGVVLSAQETATINERVNAYNAIISAVATQAGAALVDVNGELDVLASEGITVGGIDYSEAFLTGGVFSYDGVHPNTFGYAYVANLFIAAINDRFSAEIPPVNLFPFVFGPTEVIAVPGSGAGPASAWPILSPEAVRNLFWALGVREAEEGPKPPRATRNRGGRRRGGRR